MRKVKASVIRTPPRGSVGVGPLEDGSDMGDGRSRAVVVVARVLASVAVPVVPVSGVVTPVTVAVPMLAVAVAAA